MTKSQIDYHEIYMELISDNYRLRAEGVGKLFLHFEEPLIKYIKLHYPTLDNSSAENLLHEGLVNLIDFKENAYRSLPKSKYALLGWLKKHLFNAIRNDKRLHKNTKEQPFKILEEGNHQSDREDEESISNVSNSLNQSDCIQKKIKKYNDKNANELSIYIEYIFSAHKQKDIAVIFNKKLSNIKKICTNVGKELKKALDSCIEK